MAYGDSADFTLNTTDTPPGQGGAASADSADFTLNTTDERPPEFADSADFTLDTRIGGAVDIGLRVWDGAATIKIACEPPGALASPLRLQKNGVTYGILLVPPASPDASRIRIQTSSGVKALKKLP